MTGQETELRAMVASLEKQLAEARARVADADARSAAAESAKIELSLRVAELAAGDGEAAGQPIKSPNIKVVGSAVGADASDIDRLVERAEAAELAAAAATRRAAAAEAKSDELRVAVMEADKKVNALTWQVKMVTGGGVQGKEVVGAGGGRMGRVAGMFDLFGCAINDRRKGDGSG